jgi:hypothetical protein
MIEGDPLITRVPEATCPVCGYAMDAVSDFATQSRPKSGDLSVCIQCAAPLTFNDDLTMRLLRDGEFLALPLANRLDLATYQRQIRMLHCAHVFARGAHACDKCGVTREMLAMVGKVPE